MKKEYLNWNIKIDDENILWLTLDRHDTPVNTLHEPLLTELEDILCRIENEFQVRGLILRSGKPSGVLGADLEQFKKMHNHEKVLHLLQKGQDVFFHLSRLPIPKVAMIEGFFLGGALELALSCDYIIALDEKSTQIGLPEVNLGIHPGWGGTVRLPKRIGILPAMDMILRGKLISAKAAKKLGMVDEVVPMRHFIRAAHQYVMHPRKIHEASLFQKFLSKSFMRPCVGKFLLYQLKKSSIKESHYPAPFAVIKNWMEQGDDSEKAFSNELASVNKLFFSKTAKNLLHVFFLREQLKAHSKDESFSLKHVHIVGAGTMGAGIATACIYANCIVSIEDKNRIQLGKAIQHVYQSLSHKVKDAELTEMMDRLIPDENGQLVKQADIIIEAVFEDLELKKDIFKNLEKKAKSTAILATNTSSIPLENISEALEDSTRLIGLHFFNPPEKMPLVEVIHLKKTSKEVISQAFSFVSKISKLGLPVLSYPGFLVNRILMAYLLEAVKILQEGVPVGHIDHVAKEFGMPIGPIELADRVGLDVCYSVAKILIKEPDDIPSLLEKKVNEGHLGVKTGFGFYKYRKQQKINVPNKKLLKPIGDIEERLIFRMIIESIHCLEQKIITHADLIDAGLIFGAGFPPFRGGLWTYMKSLGKTKIKEIIFDLESRHGKRFACSADWDHLLK